MCLFVKSFKYKADLEQSIGGNKFSATGVSPEVGQKQKTEKKEKEEKERLNDGNNDGQTTH